MSLAGILALAGALAIGRRLLRFAIRVALLIALAAAIVSGTHLTRGGRPQRPSPARTYSPKSGLSVPTCPYPAAQGGES